MRKKSERIEEEKCNIAQLDVLSRQRKITQQFNAVITYIEQLNYSLQTISYEATMTCQTYLLIICVLAPHHPLSFKLSAKLSRAPIHID